MKKTIWVIVAIVIIAVIIGFSRRTSPLIKDKEPIKIGVIAPLSGDAAVFGEPITNSIRLAEKQINAAGGVNGQLISVIYEDGKCDGAAAVSAAQKLINIDKVKYIIDGVCSGEVLATAPIVEAAKVLVISPGATNPKISGIGTYVFRNAPSDAGRGKAIADLLSQTYKKAAIISEKTDYAEGLSSTFLAELKVKNITVVANETFATDATDYRTILAKIKQTQPDAIFLNPQTPANLIRLAKQARDLGIKAPFFASEFNDPTVTGAGPSVEGMIVAVAPGLNSGAKGTALLEAFKVEFGKEAAYPYYVGAGYDALHLFVDGIKSVGDDSTKVRDYLRGIKAYDGTIGTYSFDQNGDIVGINFVFEKVTGGKSVPVK